MPAIDLQWVLGTKFIEYALSTVLLQDSAIKLQIRVLVELCYIVFVAFYGGTNMACAIPLLITLYGCGECCCSHTIGGFL